MINITVSSDPEGHGEGVVCEVAILLSDMEPHGEVGLSGEGALDENCHCVIKFGATWRCRAFWESCFG